ADFKVSRHGAPTFLDQPRQARPVSLKFARFDGAIHVQAFGLGVAVDSQLLLRVRLADADIAVLDHHLDNPALPRVQFLGVMTPSLVPPEILVGSEVLRTLLDSDRCTLIPQVDDLSIWTSKA